MGILTSINKDFCLDLKKTYNIKYFIETKTSIEYTIWAAKNFDTVFTIEESEDLYNNFNNIHEQYKNVKWLLGRSNKYLNKIVNGINTDVDNCTGIWWLTSDRNILIEELKTILNSKTDQIIFIDNFKLLTYVIDDNKINELPRLDQILKPAFESEFDYQIYIVKDFILLINEKYKNIIYKNIKSFNFHW